MSVYLINNAKMIASFLYEYRVGVKMYVVPIYNAVRIISFLIIGNEHMFCIYDI